MKIGIQTRPWGAEMNRENLDQILGQVAGLGYDGIEIGAQHLDLAKPEQLRARLARHPLGLVGLHVAGEIYDSQSVQAALQNTERTVRYAQSGVFGCDVR